ncbi:MAG TPA: von Willebrand factor type A domain-containing protein, partial [Sphingomicrobium sp.]|nr:von Willebrand factor type A domain-containing protein [Sphingomicrobium sp.]
MSVALALLLVACAKSGIDNELKSTSDSASEAKASNLVVSGARVAEPALDAVMAMAPPPPPPPAPGTYVPPRWTPPYHDVGRDRFTSVDENPFKIVREAPVSTFSIDVDTASYSWVRASLNQNVLPQPASVRTEEMVNYFPYDYAPPRTLEQPFSTNVSVFPSPWSPGRKLVRIGIRGYSINHSTRPRANLVFLIDTSGSMQEPNKLPLVKQSLELLLDELA